MWWEEMRWWCLWCAEECEVQGSVPSRKGRSEREEALPSPNIASAEHHSVTTTTTTTDSSMHSQLRVHIRSPSSIVRRLYCIFD